MLYCIMYEAARSPKDVRTLEGAVSKLKGLGYQG